MGKDCGGGALLGPGRGASHAPPKVSCKPQAGDLREEVSRGAPMGWGPYLQDEIPDAEKPKARWRGGWEHQEACLAVLPDKNGALSDRAVPPLDKKPSHHTVLVVPVPATDSRVPLQGVPGMEGAAEGPMGGGVEGDGHMEEPVEDPGPPRRREMQPGSPRLPQCHKRGK